MNLLMMAGLDQHFSAIWCMANVPGIVNGVYRGKDGTWSTFDPPFKEVPDHKADVLHAVCKDIVAWFPQFVEANTSGSPLLLQGLRPEEIVLVDDVRTNFQSPFPDKPKIARYCKVARYDCSYRDMGFRSDMGGIGAKTDADYATLLDFVRKPWEYKAVLKAHCMERHFEKCEELPRVELVIFDFDETLTLHTWMPEDRRYASQIGHQGTAVERQHYVTYNFASPYVAGDRVEKLRVMLKELSEVEHEPPRVLAVLTKNEDGAVAVLNLLMMARLDAYFSAIWTAALDSAPRGVFREGSQWRKFQPPFGVSDPAHFCKATVISKIVEDPKAFFPQLAADESASTTSLSGLLGMTMASVVLVDDEPTNFRAGDQTCILRHCEVTRYEDDDFRDQGLVTHMGGLGAKSDEDFDELINFVRTPWLFAEREAPPQFHIPDGRVNLERRNTQDELEMEYRPAEQPRRMRALSMPLMLEVAPSQPIPGS